MIKAKIIRDEAGHPIQVRGVDLDVTSLKRLEQENLELKLAQQKALLLAILAAQEEERKRISESLHNGVGQILYATKLQLDRINVSDYHGFGTKLQAAKHQAEQLLSEAIRDIRRVSHELIPLLLEEQGLEVAIEDFCKRFAHTGLELQCHVFQQRFDHFLEVAIYRIGQELVNNIVKHAQATRARLEVYQEENLIILEAQDNGKGMDLLPAKGIGWKTIRERVKLLEGRLEIDAAPGRGTLITISLPLASSHLLCHSVEDYLRDNK